MLNVYIPASKLEELCINEGRKSDVKAQNDWFLLLTKQKVIFLDEEHQLDGVKEPDGNDTLLLLSQMYKGVRYKKASVDYNQADVAKGNLPINSKEDILLLNISDQQAQTLQQKYGIVCQSTQKLSQCALADPERKGHYSLEEGERRSWKELLTPVKGLPTNAIVFNDRYLMSHGVSEASENIKQILNELLPPDTLEREYQVLIVLDRLCKNLDEFANFATQLNRWKNNTLKRPFAIRIELLVVNRNTPGYEYTHDRRILSNCFFAYGTLQLRAYDNQGRALGSQEIDVASAYSRGLRNMSDPPSKSMRMMARQIYDLIQNAKRAVNPEDVCSVWVNGKREGIGEIKNRLIIP